jgi:Tol biopolymer transport system component
LDNVGFTFGEPTNLGPTVNSLALDKGPSISNEGLTLFFYSGSNRLGSYGSTDLWVTTRVTVDDPWSEPVNLGPNVNSSYHERNPSISADGLSLYFSSDRPGGPFFSGFHPWDLWVTTRATVDDPWSEPVNLGPTVNSWTDEFSPSISVDGMSLYFSSRLPVI